MLLYIHGRWYDTKGWEHPGGPVALQVGEARDATASFELHHPFVSRKRLDMLLAGMEVSAERIRDENIHLEEPIEREEDFVWPNEKNERLPPNDEFRTDLVTTFKAYFQGEAQRRHVSMRQASKATPQFWMLLSFLLLLDIACFSAFYRGKYWAIPCVSVLTFVITGGLTHDGSHFSLSTDWRLNQLGTHMAPWLASSSTWFIQHVIGHHAHTNIPGRDPDLYHAPHNWRYSVHTDWIPRHSSQTMLWPIIWCVATFSTAVSNEFGQTLYNGTTRTTPRTTPFYMFWYVFRLAVLVCIVLSPFLALPFWQAFFFGASLWFGLSFTFMLFSQISHLDQACGNARDSSFWKHQIATAIDYSNMSFFWTTFSAGLNAQTIHHLFPTIHPCHFRALHPLLHQVCQRHSVKYQIRSSIFEAITGYLHTLKVLSFNEADVKKTAYIGLQGQDAS